MRHMLSETFSGLRRNLTMNLAVIVTMWVSLSLFGAGLLAFQQVNLMKDSWYDKVEISVFLCNASSEGQNCSGEEITDAQRSTIEQALDTNPEVQEVYFETKQMAYDEFRRAFEGSPIQDTLRVEDMQESFRVKLVNPEEYQGVVTAISGLPGVQAIQDLHEILDPLFQWLGVLQWGAIIASGLLLAAAALQIGNMVRVAAFARRRDIGIMRLVGASNLYIVMPFVLEALLAAVVGAALACATLAAAVFFLITENAQVLIQASPWIGPQQVLWACLGVAIVALVLSIVPTLIATRRYLRV
ncbi:permease-like cell division protein FtsX [Naumannella halotolerans]|uniref:Cell division protein FtsX n=1 Tax=Naumannella halotolerans TaxID=993414 RepID=A0A4R7JA23_9ACTN|nr:permease-like cell division protein FtsX [Naumannella halotolerans]TDT33766.1 cell division transport system permease protein [Naumannella halotolerans]